MITGINVVRNCIENGYPFIESILSAYPICEEYLVNDGGSTDGTLEALKQLQWTYPKLKIYTIPDEENIRWDSVSNQINKMLRDAKGAVILLGNADELIHEDDALKVRRLALQTREDVLRFDRREITHNWTRLSNDVYHPARIARNHANIRQNWNAYGGDEFLYDHGWPDPDRRNRMGVTLYHLYNVFPLNKLNKLRNDAEYLAPGDKRRVESYEAFKGVKQVHVTPERVYGGLPALARGLPYMGAYRVRECLYNREWVESVTGLSYSS